MNKSLTLRDISMSQKLVYPINKLRLTASIQNKAYKDRFRINHYGTDMVSANNNRRFYASGNGTVKAVGYDNICGNVVSIVYKNVVNHKTNEIQDINFRYLHLEKTLVKVGQKVTKDTIIGIYGKTGSFASTGNHLHLEADLDTKYVLYTPTVLRSNFLRGTRQGAYSYFSQKNTVRNVMDYLHCKSCNPDNQELIQTNSIYVNKNDLQVKCY